MKRIKLALLKMGYREMNENVFGKPIGFHLITFELDKLLWTNWFKGNNNETHIWNSSKYDMANIDLKDDFLNFIKISERESNMNQGWNENSKYEFLIPEQYFSNLD